MVPSSTCTDHEMRRGWRYALRGHGGDALPRVRERRSGQGEVGGGRGGRRLVVPPYPAVVMTSVACLCPPKGPSPGLCVCGACAWCVAGGKMQGGFRCQAVLR